ncbi:MAG TPA: hypothetical protein VLE73_06755 [Candidatus Saccharimonadales bacterium]|nr:hypothetical protein [Candidatus Saccharimonadales bacterium]
MSKQPTILVIVGITGDLSTRKLLPAIAQMAQAGTLPEAFQVVGITRRDVGLSDVLARLPQQTDTHFLQEHVTMHRMNLEDLAAYDQLATRLEAMERELGGPAQRLFYLSIPPQISLPIVRCLGESGLAGGSARLLLEKPFGVDRVSAAELIAATCQYFSEDRIYRIDHFVAKHMVRTLLDARRHAGADWNNRTFTRVAVTISEQIDIEGRVQFYEQTGALRDVVQSHLMQLTALTLMNPTATDLRDVPALRLAALKQLHIAEADVQASAVRGQYRGYAAAVNNPHSTVETYVRLTLVSNDPQWRGVPIVLVTGKALADKKTEIRMQQVTGDDLVFADQPGGPDGYTQVFLDAINARHVLFTSSDEVLETWRIVEPVQNAWAMSDDDLLLYDPASDGP